MLLAFIQGLCDPFFRGKTCRYLDRNAMQQVEFVQAFPLARVETARSVAITIGNKREKDEDLGTSFLQPVVVRVILS